VTNGEFDWSGRREILDRIAQGVGEGQRIGRVITPHSVVARLEIINSLGASTARETWTMFLVQDLQQVGDAHAQVSEMLSDIGTQNAPMGLVNINNKGRFKIHRRWQGCLMNNTDAGSIKYLTFYHKFRKPRNIRYNGPADTDIEAGGLMLVLISSADPTINACYVSGNIRLWYTDV